MSLITHINNTAKFYNIKIDNLIMKQNTTETKLYGLRKSAALIILYPTEHSYKTLLLKRKSNMSFSSRYVFPGGVCDQADKQILKQAQFQQYSKFTALRQFLQETGLLVYPASRAHIVENKQFIGRSIKQITDDLESVWEGSLGYIEPVLRLMTPQEQKGKRYDCMFHICRINSKIKVLNISAIKQSNLSTAHNTQFKQQIKQQQIQAMAKLLFNKDESDAHAFDTATELMKGYFDKRIQLAPPQLIIFTCLINLLKTENIKQLQKFSSNPKDNYFGKIEPIMFQFDMERMVLMLFGDQNYNYGKIIQNEPESQSKNDLKLHIELTNKRGHPKGIRSIKLKKSMKLISTHSQWESNLLFKFFSSPTAQSKL